MLLTAWLHLALFVPVHCLRAGEAERTPYQDSSNGLRSVGEKPEQAQNAKIPLRGKGNTSVEINEKHRYSIGVQKKTGNWSARKRSRENMAGGKLHRVCNMIFRREKNLFCFLQQENILSVTRWRMHPDFFPDPGETAPGRPPLHVTPSCNRRVIVLNLRGNGMPVDLDLLSNSIKLFSPSGCL